MIYCSLVPNSQKSRTAQQRTLKVSRPTCTLVSTDVRQSEFHSYLATAEGAVWTQEVDTNNIRTRRRLHTWNPRTFLNSAITSNVFEFVARLLVVDVGERRESLDAQPIRLSLLLEAEHSV